MSIKKKTTEEANSNSEENTSKNMSTEKNQEPTFSLSAVQKMMKEFEDKITTQFNAQVSKLKSSSKTESEKDMDYVQQIEDDWLEEPVLFFAFCFNYLLFGDRKRGKETEPPYGPLIFKPVIRQTIQKGRNKETVSVSTLKVQTQAEVDYLRGHSQFGILFYESLEGALGADPSWAITMSDAQRGVANLSDMQIVARAKQEGIVMKQSVELMRKELIEKTARKSIADKDAKQYGNIKTAVIDQSTNREITKKTIG